MDQSPRTGPRLFLIDAYALVYRAWFAFANRPLTNAKGENTSAPFGFASFLQGILDEHRPEYMAVVFDSGRSHREQLYPAYKATREKMPDELRESLPRIEALVAAFGSRVVAVDGWEADDVIGTLAAQAVARGMEAVIVSGDKDFYQLVGPGVRLLNPGRGGPGAVAPEWVDEDKAADKFGVPPGRVVDFMSLVGDASDNVPGAPGVGPKTALKLLAVHDTVEEVLDHAEELSAKRVRESLLANRDQVLLSKELVTIRTDVPLDAEPSALRVSPPDLERLRALYVELEFRELLKRLGADAGSRSKADHILATDVDSLAELARECRETGSIGVAVLNRTLNPHRDRPAGLALSPAPGRAFYLPLAHDAGDMALDLETGATDGATDPERVANLPPLDSREMAPVRELLADPGVAKVGHDLKASLVACRREGIVLAGPLKDVMVASYVLDPGRRHQDLAALATDFLGLDTVPPAQVLGKGKERRAFGDVPAERVLDLACEIAELPLRLWDHFAGELAAQGLDRLFDEMETPLIPVLATMEMHGVRIDAPFFAEMGRRLEESLRLVRDDVHRVAGGGFNLNSTPQLRQVLFERLELPVLKRTKTGPSTDSDVLEELAADGHELPRLLLEFRRLEKLRGTYVEALPALENRATRRIHTTFNQTVAATGRLSSSDPNLQNIPVRTAEGREIRRGFKAADGALLLTADYSQIELRVLAHFSGDPVFVRAFKQDKDVHRETAAVIFGVPVDQVTGDMRARAKTVNFATLYGQGAFSLARRLGIPMDEAKAFIADYFERFSGVRRFLDEQVERAKRTGFVETLMGRRRRVPELRAKSWNVRKFGERVAQNTPVQGTAADLIKVAMIRLHRMLEGGGPEPGGAEARAGDAKMLLQVHDELVFEVREDRVEDVEAEVVQVMESAAELAVPLRVDTGAGKTWYDCKA